MSSRRQSFRQADVSRALKGARAAGQEPTRMEIAPDGRIVLSFGQSEPATPVSELDAWRAKRGTRPA